jgi:hypothetical protein
MFTFDIFLAIKFYFEFKSTPLKQIQTKILI